MVTANLKADQVQQALSFYRDLVQAISTGSALQYFLGEYNNGNRTHQLLSEIRVMKLVSMLLFADKLAE